MTEITLIQTCTACPEQYDAFIGVRQVGYLRLRHGRFAVHCPDVGGALVYGAAPNGDGVFDEDEREFYLDEAKTAIARWLSKQSSTPPPATCHFCQGTRGGVPGNENIVQGWVVCDYCHADILRAERQVRDDTLVAAGKLVTYLTGSPESSGEERTIGREIVDTLENVRLTQDGRWKSEEAMEFWGLVTSA